MSRVIGALCCAFALLCAPARAATNGQLVAVARTPAGDRLITLNPDGTGARTLLSGQRLSSPGWSPDGNRIAVVDGHRVLVLDPISGQARTVLDEAGAAAPTWAPDGTRLALLRGPDVLTIGIDGSDPRRIPVPFFGQISWVAWSPDGARLAYGTSGMLRTIGIDGADDEPLVTATELGDPAWSPDGKRIAYRDDGRLRIIPAAGGEPVDLTRTGGVEPDWSPDGREVVYAFGAGLRATGVDGGVTRSIAVPADSQSMLAEPDWQPCVAGVTVRCTSAAPTPACPDSASVTTVAGQAVDLPLGGCTDPAGRPLTVTVTRGPEHGTLAGARYTPAAGFSGQDSVLYRASASGASSNVARVTIYVLARVVPAAPAPPSRAPYLSALATPRLDKHGRGWLRARCDFDCTVKLRLTVRMRSRKTIEGPALERHLKAGRLLRLRLRAPHPKLLRSAWVRGTVTGADGRRRRFRIPVALTLTLIP
jgi:Tol biopolymer transport system component